MRYLASSIWFISSSTICTVSAVSVVLNAQIWRWWHPTTPGCESISCSIFSVSIPTGTPSNESRRLSCNTPQVDITIITAITSPIIGSTMVQPVYMMIIPEITTPTETNVSAAICRYAPFTFRSFSLSFMKSQAVTAFITTPTPAVQAIATPSTGVGWSNLPILSAMIIPTATNRITALSRETNTVLFL